MNAVAIIQARMGSSRLPGKVLADIHGRPLIGRLIDRMRSVKELQQVIVATTTNTEDDVLVEWLVAHDVPYFRGSCDDVLDRYYQCTLLHPSEFVVRVTADDPLKDPSLVSQAIHLCASSPEVDYASNTLTTSFPEGLDIEVVRFRALERAHREAKLPSEREHMTSYIWNHPERFVLRNFEMEPNLSHWRWTVDKPADLELVRRIFGHFSDKPLVGYREVIDWLNQHRELLQINAGTIRHEGYLKSLAAEKHMPHELTRRLSGNELAYVKEVLASEFRSSSGSTMMRRLEEEFSKRFGSTYAISFVNGTATMHAALEAMGVGPGDEVIVPPLTMSATTFAVLQANATPVFADVDPETFQISPAAIKRCITASTKAIITVALYGLSPDMDPIMEVANKHGIKVIEDNAECFLGQYKGRLVGTLGHCSSFSFQSSKHLTSGEGGIVLTEDRELAENIRKVQSLGYAGVSATKARITKKDIQDPDYSRHVTMGWNYRMPELCCAVALAQTERINELVQRRIDVAQIFHAATKEFHEWFVPQKVGTEYVNSYWTWVCKLEHPTLKWHTVRDAFLANGGHGVYAAWKLTYMEPMFQKLNLLGRERFISAENIARYKEGLCPVAEHLQKRLMQFKTNYWDINQAHEQADILRKTLASLV